MYLPGDVQVLLDGSEASLREGRADQVVVTLANRRDGTMIITLSDSLVSVRNDRKVTTLLALPPWRGLYPNSSVLSPDEKKLYIGMRQFVGEFDIPTKKLRLLIPSDTFLKRLPKEDEQRIRREYGD